MSPPQAPLFFSSFVLVGLPFFCLKFYLNIVFLHEVVFTNEKGLKVSQKVLYDCKPIICEECKDIGHTGEQCIQKKYELALKK